MRQPSRVNPSHLFLGTNQDNVNDKMKKKSIGPSRRPIASEAMN